MATKTSSKTATRKAGAPATGRKPAAAASKPVEPKLAKKDVKSDVARAGADKAAAGKAGAVPPSKAQPGSAAAPRHEAESVSLIDKKKPRKKTEESDTKTKRAVLPPISRIRASLETTVAPAQPAPPVEVTPAEPSAKEAETAPAVEEIAPAPEPEAASQKVILIKPPIVVKQLAVELGLKPHQLIAE